MCHLPAQGPHHSYRSSDVILCTVTNVIKIFWYPSAVLICLQYEKHGLSAAKTTILSMMIMTDFIIIIIIIIIIILPIMAIGPEIAQSIYWLQYGQDNPGIVDW
jgi:hypothetical protein